MEDRVRVDVARDEVRDHLQRDVDKTAVPERVEDAAGNGLVVEDRLFPELVVFTVEPYIASEHAHELFDGGMGQAAIVPGGGAQCRSADTFHAAVIPVEDRDVGLAEPAVTPDALEEPQRFFGGQDVRHHHAVVVAPDAVEIIERIFETAPFSVAIQSRRLDIEVAEVAALMFFSVDEVFAGLLRVVGDVLNEFLQIALTVPELFCQ